MRVFFGHAREVFSGAGTIPSSPEKIFRNIGFDRNFLWTAAGDRTAAGSEMCSLQRSSSIRRIITQGCGER